MIVMTHHYLTVDGFIYSTGIRDPFSGECLELETLPVSAAFRLRFALWLQRYHNAHCRYDQVGSEPYLHALDEEGLHLAKELKTLLGDEVKITYYSDAFNTRFLT
jgi:hypothetical protein